MVLETKRTVQLSSNSYSRCDHCEKHVGGEDPSALSDSINHYIGVHGYALLHAGTQTSGA